jgi:rare lipoprotein A
MNILKFSVIGLVVLLAACSSTKPPTSSGGAYDCVYNPSSTGGFYKDDGPHSSLPGHINQVPEPTPKVEALNKYANRPYTVLGKNYTPMTKVTSFEQSGVGSWYGRKFHGQKTSIGETYDMYAMTAAHPTLAIPSYVRVTNLENGRSVVVRVNDRGPFLHERVIDLTFLAACRLGYAAKGSANVKVETIVPGKALAAAVAPTPAPVAPTPAKPEAIPIVEQGKGVFIQLGAFSSQSNAQNFRLKMTDATGQPASRIQLQEGGGLFRVRMGPYADKAQALAEAERLTGEHNIIAVLVKD